MLRVRILFMTWLGGRGYVFWASPLFKTLLGGSERERVCVKG